MTKEHILYIGIFGLLLSILNLLVPYLKKAFSYVQFSLYQHSSFKIYDEKIEKFLQAQGKSLQHIQNYRKKNYTLFWLLLGVSVYLMILTKSLIYIILPFLYGFYILKNIQNQLHRRNHDITKMFPYFLDIFILCLESGMDNVRSIKEIAQTQPKHPLYQELQWVIHSTQVGQPVSKSLLTAANRTKSEDLYFLAHSIAQSNELGTSLAGILRLHSSTLRDKIFKNAQQEAQKAPVKILFPLIFCIFPVVFIILFVPIALQLVSTL